VPLICALYIGNTLLLVYNSNWSASSEKFLNGEVEKIDDQFCNLHLAFNEQGRFTLMLQNSQACSAVQSFEQFWSPLWSEIEDLQRFCGAIASNIPGTSTVESDFSLINLTKHSSSQSLTDFALESILHCKQYQKHRDLFEWNYRRFMAFICDPKKVQI